MNKNMCKEFRADFTLFRDKSIKQSSGYNTHTERLSNLKPLLSYINCLPLLQVLQRIQKTLVLPANMFCAVCLPENNLLANFMKQIPLTLVRINDSRQLNPTEDSMVPL